MSPSLGHARCRGAAIRCALLLAIWTIPLAAQPRRLGRIAWTELQGTNFRIVTKQYAPNPAAASLDAEGLAQVQDGSYLLDRSGSIRIEKSGALPTDGSRSTVALLHASLDFTGKRFLFTSGETWGPAQVPTAAKPTHPPAAGQLGGGTKIHFGKPDNPASDPSRTAGGAMDAFPVSDPQGKTVYFARFFSKAPESGSPPGWYLMSRTWDAVSGKTSDPETFVLATGNKKVRGSQPSVSSNGEYLLFVREDPRNTGTDLWTLRLPAAQNEAKKLWEGEGESDFTPPAACPEGAPPSCRDPWNEYSRKLGRARISHPVLSPDLGFVVFACDRDGDYDLYKVTVQRGGDGSLQGQTESQIVGDAENGSDQMWPSLNGDGKMVAFMSDEGSPGKTRIYTATTDGSGSPEVVTESSEGSMWPWWDQDEDPPHVLISLRPSDGTPPLVLRIQDDDPDPSNASDAFTMSLEVRDYNPLIPPVPAEPPSSLAPIRIGATGGPDPVHLEYPTNGPTANSLKLLLMGGRDNLGEHLGLRKLFVPTGTPGQASSAAFSDPLLSSEQFGGLFVFENTRLEVKVIARDNRWKRVGPSGSMAGSYSTDPIEEARQILPEDPRSLARPSGESDPPYLDIVPRNELDNGRPGIAWWVEEAPRGSADETAVKVSSPSFENAPHVLFRVANYPPDGGSGSDEIRRTDFFLRVVARDLLANVTDVRIPVYVKDKSFAVSTLESGSERKR